MIIETRIWDTKNKVMVYQKPLVAARNASGELIGVVGINQIEPQLIEPLTAFSNPALDPVMLKSPIADRDGRVLWEADIIECGVVTDVGLIKAVAVMVYRPDKGGFIVQMNEGAFGKSGDFKVTDTKFVGTIYENPEIKLKTK